MDIFSFRKGGRLIHRTRARVRGPPEKEASHAGAENCGTGALYYRDCFVGRGAALICASSSGSNNKVRAAVRAGARLPPAQRHRKRGGVGVGLGWGGDAKRGFQQPHEIRKLSVIY